MSAWPEPFDLAATLTCGQCFRWRENPDGSFTGTAAGRTLTVRQAIEDFGLTPCPNCNPPAPSTYYASQGEGEE